MCALVEYTYWPPDNGAPFFQTGALDFPNLRDFDYSVDARIYRLNGTGHLSGFRLGSWMFTLKWCRGRRVK